MVIELFLLSALVRNAHALIDPIRDPALLQKPKVGAIETKAVRLKTAKVVLKDVALIQRDFPETKAMSNSEIDDWLVKSIGYMSANQVDQGFEKHVMRTPHENENVDPRHHHFKLQDQIQAYRPDQYGRALVMKLGNGLVDVKGAGGENPNLGLKSTGLMPLSEGIREYAYEKVVQKVFDHSQSGFKTVGTYAVIDTGLDVNLGTSDAKANYHPAGLVLRQAHIRSKEKGTILPTDIALEREKVLRRYGISSAATVSKLNKNKNKDGEVMNMQGTTDGALVDFGQYVVLNTFKKRMVSCRNVKQKSGQEFKVLMDPASPDFIQPDPKFKLPDTIWGFGNLPGQNTSPTELPQAWSDRLARYFREGMSQEDIAQVISTQLKVIDVLWRCASMSEDLPESSDRKESKRPIGLPMIKNPFKKSNAGSAQ